MHLRLFFYLHYHAFDVTNILEVFFFLGIISSSSSLFAMIDIIEIDALYSVDVELLMRNWWFKFFLFDD